MFQVLLPSTHSSGNCFTRCVAVMFFGLVDPSPQTLHVPLGGGLQWTLFFRVRSDKGVEFRASDKDMWNLTIFCYHLLWNLTILHCAWSNPPYTAQTQESAKHSRCGPNTMLVPLNVYAHDTQISLHCLVKFDYSKVQYVGIRPTLISFSDLNSLHVACMLLQTQTLS